MPPRRRKPKDTAIGRALGLDREQFLCVLGADPKRWAARYGLAPFTTPCGRCGSARTTSIPFAVKHFRGLIAPLCACGYDDRPYAIVRYPATQSMFAEIEDA